MSDDGPRMGRLLVAVLVVVAGATAASWILSGTGGDTVTTSPAASTEGYQLWATRADGSPVRWNPCEAIDWVLNPSSGPEEAVALVREAFDRIGEATGLDFRHLGTTDEEPVTNRQTVLADRYGSRRWAPVLVAWTSPDRDTPLLSSDQALAIPVAVDGVFVTGQVLLNADTWLSPDFVARSQSWGGALVHEAGHLVGLDHVDDPQQLMYRLSGQGPVAFGDGDLAGLSAVGSGVAGGQCLDAGEPRSVQVDVQQRR